MAKLLTIDLEKEYKLRIEDSTEIKTSFFKDVYKQAFEQVKNIEKWSSDSLKNQSKDIFSRESREYNNIIAFTGERGTGKSSAMLTVANTLVKYPLIKSELVDVLPKDGFEAHFESLHTIDPSKFEKHQNIIEVILAELFEKFQNQIKDANNQYNDNDKRTVLKAFQDVYQCLKVISNSDQTKKYEGDALETLAKLADATKLEKNIQNLIKEYLKFIHPDKAQGQSILIIPIDDFDLNVKHAGEMAEQIRKYLMIPQVMVLMAINLEQFGDVKTQDVIDDFKVLLDYSKLSDYPRDVAARYILKLIPIERRILIPNVRIERNNVQLKLFKGTILNQNKEVIPQNIIIEPENENKIEKQIFDYIFDCTGLCFISNEDEYHVLLPNTLREFVGLANLLGCLKKPFLQKIIHENLNEVEKTKIIDENKLLQCENYNIYKYNLQIFSEYFIQTWIKDFLLNPFKEMINESLLIPDSNWNKYFITSIVEIISREKLYRKDWNYSKNDENYILRGFDELNLIIDRNNYASNISLGDLIYFFMFLQNHYIYDYEIKKLDFSIKCWYSINLTLLRNEYQNLLDNNKIETEYCKNIITKIQSIVNGTIVNQEMEIIRGVNSSKKRIQFDFQVDKSIKDQNNFILHNIFIKNDISKRKRTYRLRDKFVSNQALESIEKLSKPTFNLFAFVCKDASDLFVIPYNNLEQWSYILSKIDKDYKEPAASTGILIANLFKQIDNNLNKQIYKEEFLRHPIVKLFYSRDNGKISFILTENTKYKFIDDLFKKASTPTDNEALIIYLKKSEAKNPSSLMTTVKTKTNNDEIIEYIKTEIDKTKIITKDVLAKLISDIESNFNNE